MTVHAADLENAIAIRDGIKKLDVFLSGLSTWRGRVEITFGGYCAVILADGVRHDDIQRLAAEERKRLAGMLDDLGIEFGREN